MPRPVGPKAAPGGRAVAGDGRGGRRRSYELLEKDIGHLHADNGRLDRGVTDVRADIRRLDEKIDAVRGSSSASSGLVNGPTEPGKELSGYPGGRRTR